MRTPTLRSKRVKRCTARRGALEKAGEVYCVNPATADPAHREVVFFCMLFSS
jgi:hypothetical protein